MKNMRVVNFRACYNLTETLIIYYITDSDVDMGRLHITTKTISDFGTPSEKKSARGYTT